MEKIVRCFKYLLTGQFGKLLSALWEKIPRWIYRRGHAYIFEKERPCQEIVNGETESATSDFVFRLLRKEDLPACTKLIKIPLRECYRRYDAGDLCFGAFHGGELVNLAWVHQGPFYVRGVGYYHNSGENIAFTYNAVTDSMYRRKGIHRKSIYLRSKLLFGKGVQKIVTMVMSKNQISMNNLQDMGFKKTKKLWHLAMLGIKYTVVEDLENKDVKRKIFLRIPKGMHVI